MSALRPRAPTSLHQAGLDIGVLAPLGLKVLYYSSHISEREMAEQLGLSLTAVTELLKFLTREHLCEVTGGRGDTIGASRYALTGKGIERATSALSTSGYVGKAPVPFEEYVAQVRRQTVQDVTFDPAQIEAALSDLVLPKETVDSIGQALSSKRSFLMHGASGNGKTSAAIALKKAMPGQIIIPYAIEFMREIIQVYDASAHELVEDTPDRDEHGAPLDRRWAVIRRPAILVAGELAANQLELMLDDVHKTYDAPVQVKANGGLLIVDDFGRQQLDAAYLLNRWVTPLERGIDYLSLHSGARMEVPFDAIPVFVSNRPPAQLADEAFLRRIRYKVEITSPDRAQYMRILEHECERNNVAYDAGVAGYLVDKVYGMSQREMRGCHPRDLVEVVADAARYAGVPGVLNQESVDQAVERYFVNAA